MEIMVYRNDQIRSGTHSLREENGGLIGSTCIFGPGDSGSILNLCISLSFLPSRIRIAAKNKGAYS